MTREEFRALYAGWDAVEAEGGDLAAAIHADIVAAGTQPPTS
ncbi:hypothetical protein [Cryobacterium melibiosiphilum]|nr:hypothetical protein [Cryobacterium melibiosiphilum]